MVCRLACFNSAPSFQKLTLLSTNWVITIARPLRTRPMLCQLHLSYHHTPLNHQLDRTLYTSEYGNLTNECKS